MSGKLTPEDYMKMIDDLFLNQLGPINMEIDGKFIARWYNNDGNVVLIKDSNDTLFMPSNLFNMFKKLLGHTSNRRTIIDIITYFEERYSVIVTGVMLK